MVKGQSAHSYPRDLIKLDIVLPPTNIQEGITHLNSKAEKDFLTDIKKTNDSLETTRNKIEDLIINGKAKHQK